MHAVFCAHSSLTIHVYIQTDTGETSPNLAQILIRETTPEDFFAPQGAVQWIRKITYRLEHPDHKREAMNKENFISIFDKCRELVEDNNDIIEMRELEELLGINGEQLKQRRARKNARASCSIAGNPEDFAVCRLHEC